LATKAKGLSVSVERCRLYVLNYASGVCKFRASGDSGNCYSSS